MLWFQYPDLCEFRLLGRPRRTKEEDLKVRTYEAVEGSQTRSSGHGRGIADGREVHFGALMELRSTNNKPARERFWIYKGRIVFGGTLIR